MENFKVFDCSNVLIGCYVNSDCLCTRENREHTLLYLLSGELEIEENGSTTTLHPGDCAFMRRDVRMHLQKKPGRHGPYRSVVLKFLRPFLREFYKGLRPDQIPFESRRSRQSLYLLPHNRPDIQSLFESVMPYFESGEQPSPDVLKLKMTEGVYVLLHTDPKLYASLFDFVEPWKIDILDYLNENYMFDLSMSEIARYTGRSLSTFKRDFAKVSDLTPQKWILRRRLEAARDLIRSGSKSITEVCFEVGFKNLSHFSRLYKECFGMPPSSSSVSL